MAWEVPKEPDYSKSQNTTLTAVFAEEEGCSGLYLEYPESNVPEGNEIDIKLWAGSISLLTGLELKAGTISKGPGILKTGQDMEPVTESVSFEGSTKAQASRPINSIVSAVANSLLFYLNEKQDPLAWITKGDSLLPGKIKRKDYSCLQLDTEKKIFGSVDVTFTPAPYSREWEWKAPKDGAGDHWFFLYQKGELINMFKISVVAPEETDEGEAYCVLVWRDYNTNKPIANAKYQWQDDGDWIDKGTTDENGMIDLGVVKGKQFHRLLASGYVDTSMDDMDENDYLEP